MVISILMHLLHRLRSATELVLAIAQWAIYEGQTSATLTWQFSAHLPSPNAAAFNFRSEFFNFTNTPSFGQPVTDYAAGAAFEVISSTVSNPRIIQFALKYAF
jgi:hypothetical protein